MSTAEDTDNERGSALLALARRRERFERLLTSISDLLVLIGPDGRVRFCNRSGGADGPAYPRPGDRAEDFVAEGDRPAFARAVQDVLSGRSERRDLLFRLPDGAGGDRVIEGTLTSVLEDGRVVVVELLGRDVTEHHRVVQALRSVNKRLRAEQARFRRDLEAAGKVHASLLPGGFQTERVLIDLEHKPLLGVGGDYVYIDRQDAARPTLIVFDVSGHGIASALVANRMHSAVYAILNQGSPPPEMLGRLNRFIFESFSDLGIFATLFGLRLDLEAGRACYCGAGHPPALLRKGSTGQILQLRSAHLPIGATADVFVGEPAREVEIAPGDLIWIYTDGLTELRDAEGNMLGIDGLTRRLQDCPVHEPRPGSARRCLRKVLTGMKTPQDDVTLVLAAIR